MTEIPGPPRILACYALPDACHPQFTAITTRYSTWHRSSLFKRIWILFRLSPEFDACVFDRSQTRLTLLMAILTKLRLFRPKICLEDLFFDHPIIRNEGTGRTVLERTLDLKYLFLRVFMASVDVLCVHTRREVEILGKALNMGDRPKFVFVPAYVNVATLEVARRLGASAAQPGRPYALIAGTLRDYETAIRAFGILKSDAGRVPDLDLVVICRAWDREALEPDRAPAPWLHVLVDVPWREYLRLLKHSLFSIVPLHHDRPLRSLGQTQCLESWLLSKPVICADTFHLGDYITPETALTYRAESPESLSEKIRELCQDRELYRGLAKRGFELAHESYNQQQYLTRLANAVCDARE